MLVPLQAADTRAAEEAAEIPDTNQEDKQDVKDMMEEAKFVTEAAKGGEPELDAQGEPVPVDEVRPRCCILYTRLSTPRGALRAVSAA